MRILIKDHWAKNLGDIAIAEAMIKNLRLAIPGVEIVLESSHPEFTQKYFPDVEICPRLFRLDGVRHVRKIISFEFILKNIPFIIRNLWVLCVSFVLVNLGFQKYAPRAAQEYAKADLVISAGGDFLSKEYAYYLRLYEIYLIKKLNKPICLFAQSIGPFDKRRTKFVSNGLSRVDLILVRDKKSFELMKEYGVTAPYFMTADSALLLNSNNSVAASEIVKKYQLDKNTIGLTVRDIKYAGLEDDFYHEYKKGLVDLINFLKMQNYHLVFLSPNRDDYDMAEKLNQEHGFGIKNINLLELMPSEVIGLMGNIKFLISSRMHPIILCSIAGTPVIGLGKEFKMRNYLDRLGLEEYYLDMLDLRLDRVRPIVERLVEIENYSKVKEAMSRKVNELKKQSQKNIEILGETFFK